MIHNLVLYIRYVCRRCDFKVHVRADVPQPRGSRCYACDLPMEKETP